jgi:hypothetical protein
VDGVDVSFVSCPGSASKSNEDFVTASPSVAVVLDGLSAPPALGTGCLHGTPWFVTQLGMQLVSAATTARDEPLEDVVASAIARVADSHAHSCDLEHPGTPSSSLAILREHAQRVECLLLFDSVIVLDGPSGLTVVTDRRVDAIAREEHLATHKHPIGSPGHQNSVQGLVAAQRRHRNQPSGYWVAGAKPAAAYQAVTGSWPRDQVSRAALLSDGSPAWSSCTRWSTGRSCWASSTSTDPRTSSRLFGRSRRLIRQVLAGRGTSAATTQLSPSAYSARVTR